MMFVSLNNNMTDVTSGAETTNPSQAPELIQVISGVRFCQILDFCVVFCRSLFVLFHLTIVCSALLRFTESDYPLWYLQTVLNEHYVHKQRSTQHYKEN